MTRRIAPAALGLAGCLLLLLVFHGAVAAGRFDDPDDLLRLQQVRDLLGGQGWFDVGQHRITPPTGLSMHWSRLVDLPIAGLILLLRPLGAAAAESWAAALAPLLAYAAAAALLWRLAIGLSSGPVLPLLVLALLPLDPGVLATLRPMRIDHHGWQAVCGLGIALGLVRGDRGGAALAGLAAALWAHLSLEALPFAAAAGALLGVRWALDPATGRGCLPLYLAAFAGGGVVLYLGVHGGSPFAATGCDAVSPLHLGLLAAVAGGAALVQRAGLSHPWQRVAALAVVVALAAAGYRLDAPQCAAGPFAGLDPIVRRLWYLNTLEGRPLWEQAPAAAAFTLGYPLVGLTGAGLAWRSAAGPARRRWADLAALLAAATVIGIGLYRAGALANLLALPGGAWLLLAVLRRLRRVPAMMPRVCASVAAALLLLPPVPMLAAALASSRPAPAEQGCTEPANLARLGQLPPATILTPLNMANAVLVATPHRLVASVYHRDGPAIADVLRVFTGTEAQARAAAARRGADYLLICPGAADLAVYRRAAPDGLAARLERGSAPAWLRPVAVPGLHHARLWRIEPIAAGAPPQ